MLSILVAVSAHGGANLFNDYFDHLNGSDEMNISRIGPFTGGSRFIQNKTLSPSMIYKLALALIITSIALGIYICSQTTWKLIPIGAFGVFIAWTYSAPPLQLMSKGILGELAITIAWSLIVIGFSTLTANQLNAGVILVGISYGLMVSNILLINQIPDREADQKASKYTLATQYSTSQLNYWYTSIYFASYICLLFAVYIEVVPINTLLTLLLVPAFISCSVILSDATLSREKLKSLIVRNLVSVHAFTLLMCLSLIKCT
jgi:1,4-dihydroxy-2-naphthoate octaprenyltransferase